MRPLYDIKWLDLELTDLKTVSTEKRHFGLMGLVLIIFNVCIVFLQASAEHWDDSLFELLLVPKHSQILHNGLSFRCDFVFGERHQPQRVGGAENMLLELNNVGTLDGTSPRVRRCWWIRLMRSTALHASSDITSWI
jgi:hypothetical protein